MRDMQKILVKYLTNMIGETNGVSLIDTLNLLLNSDLHKKHPEVNNEIKEFRELLDLFRTNKIQINQLLEHSFSTALSDFFKHFPLKYREEHIHLTGSLTADFIFPRLKVLLDGPNRKIYEDRIKQIYGPMSLPITSPEDVDKLIRLKENEGFLTYLKILYIPQLIFINKQVHTEAAYHMATELYHKYNVGHVRLKFSLSRSTSSSSEQIPGVGEVSSEDVVLGLYDGFMKFKKQNPDFTFTLSPSFRKESHHFNKDKFKSRRDHFMQQVDELVTMMDKYPFLESVMTDVDTVGDEKELYRKEHFNELSAGFRKLQYRGFKIRSHHGETFHTLKKGIQAVDNAMNIWHIDTLEHGISLGINPNTYFHRLYQEVIRKNRNEEKIDPKDSVYQEVKELDWGDKKFVLDKLLNGITLTSEEEILFLKAKFHTAREVEHYQHDVLNRLIQKDVALISLPSSNNKLTGRFQDYKEHPFSWWEKKGVQLGVGTDNYITLNTNYIEEMMILLYTDAGDLKITKLLMVTTGENRRPYISHLLWKMHKRNHLQAIHSS